MPAHLTTRKRNSHRLLDFLESPLGSVATALAALALSWGLYRLV